METIGALLMFGLILGIWYFNARRVVRGRRARKEVKTLANTLSETQAEDFDQTYLPQASNIFEQRALLIRYIKETNQS